MALNSGYTNNKNIVTMGGGGITRVYNDRTQPGAAVTFNDSRTFANGSPIIYGTTTENSLYLHSEIGRTISRDRSFHNGPNNTLGTPSSSTGNSLGPGGN